MSLVTNFVRAVDGKFYQDPKLYGDDWYICFDDEDPPELVFINKDYSKKQVLIEAERILKAANIPFAHISSVAFSGRLYPPLYEGFRQSCSVFFVLTAPIPIPRKWDSIKEKWQDMGQAVIYDPGERS